MPKVTSFLSIIFIFALLAIPQESFSATFKFGQDYFLKKGEEIKGDLYVASGNLTLAGPVSGDIFAAGLLNIFTSDQIGRDALFLGWTLNSLANVNGNLRIFADNALVGGNIGRDLVVVARETKVHPDASISGNATIVAGKVFFDGKVEGQTYISGGEIFLNGTFEDLVEIDANQLSIGPDAVLNGGLHYSSSLAAVINENAKINGEIVFKEMALGSGLDRFIPTFWGVWFLIKFVVLLIGALVLHGIFRRISDRFVSEGAENSLRSLLWGFLFVLAVPVSLFIVALTFVGIPFLFIGFSIFLFVLCLAFFYSPILTGAIAKRYFTKEKNYTVTWKTIVLGIAILTALSYIPYAGIWIRGVIFLTALGAILYVLVKKFSEVR